MANDPVAHRIADLTDAQRAAGYRSRLDAFEEALATPESHRVYLAWLENPITQVYLSTLREIGYLPFARGILPSGQDLSVEYGMTLAIQFVCRLIEDPESVTNAFRKSKLDPSVRGETPEETGYTDAPDL